MKRGSRSDASQLEVARLVASLRQLGMPLARIKTVIGMDTPAAAHTDDLFAIGRDLIARVRPVAPPRAGDPVTAPFVIFHGEVSEDSDGPIEWCWPVPADQAGQIASRFPDLALRSDSAHQEAFIHVGQAWPGDAARITPVVESLRQGPGRRVRRGAAVT